MEIYFVSFVQFYKIPFLKTQIFSFCKDIDISDIFRKCLEKVYYRSWHNLYLALVTLEQYFENLYSWFPFVEIFQSMLNRLFIQILLKRNALSRNLFIKTKVCWRYSLSFPFRLLSQPKNIVSIGFLCL